MTHPSTHIHPPAVELDGRGLRIGIVVARYNWHITGQMLTLAQEELASRGVAPAQTRVVTVPGAFELATMAQAMLTYETYDALICFGCVMKGATRHDVIVADAAAQGLQEVALQHKVPVVLGVMCAETQQQAEERIPRGRECAQTAIEMAQTLRSFRKQESPVYQEV